MPNIKYQITLTPSVAAISVLPVVERPPTKCKIMQRHHHLQTVKDIKLEANIVQAVKDISISPVLAISGAVSLAVVAHCTGGETSHKMQNNATSPSSATTSSDIRSVKDFRLDCKIMQRHHPVSASRDMLQSINQRQNPTS